MKTICKRIENLKENKNIKNDKEIIKELDIIKQQAGKMEDRLLSYCNAIEELGFKRIGRDYKNQ